jgi:putative SOS response-associated peptidase YedK
MEEIHNRMPVILNKQGRYKWLDSDLKDTSELKEMLIPYPSEEMEAYEISTFVNSPKNNSEECIDPSN